MYTMLWGDLFSSASCCASVGKSDSSLADTSRLPESLMNRNAHNAYDIMLPSCACCSSWLSHLRSSGARAALLRTCAMVEHCMHVQLDRASFTIARGFSWCANNDGGEGTHTSSPLWILRSATSAQRGWPSSSKYVTGMALTSEDVFHFCRRWQHACRSAAVDGNVAFT